MARRYRLGIKVDLKVSLLDPMMYFYFSEFNKILKVWKILLASKPQSVMKVSPMSRKMKIYVLHFAFNFSTCV
jgi:hypothetical protein